MAMITTTRSAILILPRTQKFASGKISGFERKSFTRQNSPDSKVFGFKVPTLNSGKISGDELNDHLQTHARGCSSVGRPMKGQRTPNRRGVPTGSTILQQSPNWGVFYFGFVHLRVNGKTNPVLKHSGFVTNPEQFPVV